jgi:ABC-2 type transport system permease protein
MNRLRVMLGVYKQYWRINVLTTLEYRENFLIWFAFTFVYHGSAVAALWIVLNRFPSMNGWTFRDMAFLYGLWMLAHALHNTFFSTVGDIPEHIRDGEFDRLLVRPLDTLFQAIATPGQVFPDELILALSYFVAATIYCGVVVDGTFLVFVPLIVLGGALIDLAFNLVISTVAFWFVRVDALRWIVLQLEQEFTRYPISIYSRGVRLLLTFVVPFAFMNCFPARYFLHKAHEGAMLPPAVGLLTPAIGLLCVTAAYVFWRFGLNRYSGVGH